MTSAEFSDFLPLPLCHIQNLSNRVPFVCFLGTPSPHPLRTSYKYAPKGGVKSEARQALKNMGEVLKAAGGTFNNVVKCTVLLQHMSDFNEVNDVYKEFFTENEPARAAYQVAALPRGALIEIEAVAVIGNIQDEKDTNYSAARL